ncbi:MAG: IPT/TIG domain-containing protein, partial [Candidatus Bathyarchaeia archaeon]
GEILTNVTSTANGVIDVYVVVPDVKSSLYYFYANKTSINIEGDLPDNCYSASFTVKSPTITISPSSGPVCSSVRVSGNYFKINYLVNITLMKGTTVEALLATNVPTNATGGFRATVTIPYCTEADIYKINATDGINSAAQDFEVSSPSITVSPASAMVGETITVEGQNFAIQRDVTIYFSIRRTGARYELIPVKTVTTNATGGFRATVIVPEVPSDYPTDITDIVEVNVTDGCNYETQDFDVIPSIRISPVRGTPGDTVEVTGTGFRNQTTVTIYFDDQEVATTSTNEYGSFTARFTVPSVPDGLYTVTATDAVNNYATADFQVIAVEFKMILDAIDELERKLDYIKPKIDALTEKIETIGSCINAIIYRMGGFYGEDTVASLLYSIEAKLDALPDAIGSAKAEILDAIQGISLDLTPVLDAIGSAKAEILDAIATVEAKLGALEDIMGKLDEIPKKDWWDLVHLANFRRMVQFVAGSYSTTMPTSDNPVDLERGSKVTLTVRVADDETAGFVIRVYINDGTSWQPLSFSVPGIANADCAATVVFTTGANGDFYFEVDGATFIAYIYSAEFPPV